MKWKICGMKFSANILELAKLKPDYMGFIFYKKSPRYVGDDFEMPLIDPAIKRIGVFVNEEKERVIEVIKKYDLDGVQLHGEESPDDCKSLRKLVPVVKTFSLNGEINFSLISEYENKCDYILFDTASIRYGGTGMKFDWTLIENEKIQIPFFISGGLDLGDVEKIKEQFRGNKKFMGMDFNSRFEISPGLKSIEKLKILQNELYS